MFLKEIRDETNKARDCVDGRPQRLYTNKEEASLPTISIEAMMLSCAKDAKENGYMVVSDIPGVFLHADMKDNIHISLQGIVAEIIITSNNVHKHLWYIKHGNAMLYVQLKNSLIGDTTSSTTVLETTLRDTTGMGIYIQPI